MEGGAEVVTVPRPGTPVFLSSFAFDCNLVPEAGGSGEEKMRWLFVPESPTHTDGIVPVIFNTHPVLKVTGGRKPMVFDQLSLDGIHG